MAHRYFPHTQEDVETMLNICKVKKIDDLFADIPKELLFKDDYNIPVECTEQQVRDFFKTILEKNTSFTSILAGGGYYHHIQPAVIPAILSRSEFLTAYTPYQPEISQGTLQYIFEYQTLMARLTGMEISNASLYDGATATAEAMILAVTNARKKNRVMVSDALNPEVKRVLETYARNRNISLTYIPLDKAGSTDVEFLKSELDKNDVAGVIVASPNYYGILEDYTDWADLCHQHKALFIINAVASDLVSIKSPGEWGADVAVGDAQSLGIPLNSGGPYLGYICCSKSLMRKIPGRIVGMTKDRDGYRSFVLTLQAREQHIRREKATSNICSNQGLMTLYVTIYMSLLGVKGIKEINEIGVDGAHWFADELIKTGKVALTYPEGIFFNEFYVTFSSAEIREKYMLTAIENKILPGLKIGEDKLLIAVTETARKEDLERLCSILKSI